MIINITIHILLKNIYSLIINYFHFFLIRLKIKNISTEFLFEVILENYFLKSFLEESLIICFIFKNFKIRDRKISITSKF